jgi:hypothetical protein
MILLFIAFLCALVYWLADSSFKDDVSKKALIPGFKVTMLIFAFTLVLVDVYMFVETNRLVMASANSINGSCVSYIGSQMMYPTSMAAVNGTLMAGNLASLFQRNDGNVASFNEVVGTPGANISINFTSASNFTTLHFTGRTDEPGATFHVDFITPAGATTTVLAFSDSTGYIDTTAVFNGSGYVNGSNVTAYVASTGAGNVSSRLYLDWFVLSGSQTYTAYCDDSEDTQTIFIYHRMENDIMLLLLNMLPFLGMMIMAIILIQVLMLGANQLTGKKGEG